MAERKQTVRGISQLGQEIQPDLVHSIIDGKVQDRIQKGQLDPKALQVGRASVIFPFTMAGEENVSVSISFPVAFDAVPSVALSVEGVDVGIVNISTTTSGFTITVRNDKGTDYTADQSATVNYIALAV